MSMSSKVSVLTSRPIFAVPTELDLNVSRGQFGGLDPVQTFLGLLDIGSFLKVGEAKSKVQLH
jgi:hypothetical protein